jgi:hypothetical protein
MVETAAKVLNPNGVLVKSEEELLGTPSNRVSPETRGLAWPVKMLSTGLEELRYRTIRLLCLVLPDTPR